MTSINRCTINRCKVALASPDPYTQEILEGSNQTQLDALTREDIMGDMVYAATLSYYAQMIAQGKMATRPLKAEFEVVGSSGIIGYKPKIAKRFGLPTGLSAGGMNCDLIDAHMAGQSQGDAQRHLQANQQLGMIGSSLEHQVLEQLFATDPSAEGFSAVKAIQLANHQGQKFYTITQENYQEVIPQLQLAPDAIADIQGAAKAGLTVTTHQKRISINGYTGEGYIILNERGTGAYLINGGLYGGVMTNGVGNRSMFANSILGTTGYYENIRNVLVGFAMVVAGQTHNAYLEFGKLWDLTTVKLKQDAGVIIQVIMIGGTFGASPLIGSWNNAFIFWYYYGKGKAVDLKDWNLGIRFENGGNVPSLVNSFMNEQIRKLRTEGRCGEDYSYSYKGPPGSDVTWEYHLFSVGRSQFFREVSCSGGMCTFTFHIEDEFTDPLDGRKYGDEKPFDLPGASPYDINYSFERTKSCF